MDLICGINPVLEALGAGTRHLERLLVVKGLRNRRIHDLMRRASELGVALRFEARETLDRLAEGVPHQGIIAVASAKAVVGLEDLLDGARPPGLVVVLDGVEDPRNLGAILRTVEAAGADGVVLPYRHSAGLSETVNRASAGAMEHVRVARAGNLVQALEAVKARGFWVVGFEAGSGRRWDAIDYRRPLALVFGGEGHGIRRLVREHCDELASLPVFGHVTSLNVSVAAGIALFEVIRQRGAVPSHVRPIPPGALPPSARRIVGPGPEDAEHDPGGLGPGEGAAAEPAPEEEAEPGPGSVVFLSDSDEAGWRGPKVLRPLAGRRGRDGRRARSQKWAPRSERPPRRGSPQEAAGSGAGGRRRHRRRGKGAGGPVPPAEASSEPAIAAEPRAAHRTEPEGTASPAAEGREPRARRGRRRRRRRRGPGASGP
jgi:23S rRNA (guanosine2251-2'-O)-methyltransferase